MHRYQVTAMFETEERLEQDDLDFIREDLLDTVRVFDIGLTATAEIREELE